MNLRVQLDRAVPVRGVDAFETEFAGAVGAPYALAPVLDGVRPGGGRDDGWELWEANFPLVATPKMM